MQWVINDDGWLRITDHMTAADIGTCPTCLYGPDQGGTMPATSLLISHHEMNTARAAGRARPLSQAITEFVKYWGDWWISSSDGWLRITDTHLASRLEIVRARLDASDEDAACRQSQQQEESSL